MEIKKGPSGAFLISTGMERWGFSPTPLADAPGDIGRTVLAQPDVGSSLDQVIIPRQHHW